MIKEIVEGGGRVSGTNAMRLHVYRDDNVADGMAYGVYCPVTVGDVITISVWLKRADSRGEGKSIGYSTYFGSGYSGSSTSFGSLNTEWTRYQYTWTASNTLSFYSYWWPNGTTAPYAIDMCDFQVEINGHATQFTTGTRSATQGLIDRTGNSTIDISDVSFDSDAEITFDGTDDKAVIANFPHVWNSSLTLEAVVSWNDDSRSVIFGNYNVGANDINFEKLTSRKLRFYWNRGERDVVTSSNVVTTSGDYHHVVFTRGTTFRIYVDGVLVTESSGIGTNVASTGSTFRVGGDTRNGATIHNGNIPVLKVYNQALTAAEVLQNYNATKGRFS